MPGLLSFQCHQGDKQHDGSPNYSYQSPVRYGFLSEPLCAEFAQLAEDVGWIKLADYSDGALSTYGEIPITSVIELGTGGAWLSLSHESMPHYLNTWDAPALDRTHIGWLCTPLRRAPATVSSKTRVQPRAKGLQARLTFEEVDHPLARALPDDIAVARAQEMAAWLMHAQTAS